MSTVGVGWLARAPTPPVAPTVVEATTEDAAASAADTADEAKQQEPTAPGGGSAPRNAAPLTQKALRRLRRKELFALAAQHDVVLQSGTKKVLVRQLLAALT